MKSYNIATILLLMAVGTASAKFEMDLGDPDSHQNSCYPGQVPCSGTYQKQVFKWCCTSGDKCGKVKRLGLGYVIAECFTGTAEDFNQVTAVQ
jgi:hypothetical protein